MLVPILVLISGLASAQETPSTPPPDDGGISEADRSRAISLFNNGKVLFDEGNYLAAVAAWEKAYELTEEPELQFNIASAYERAGEYDKALVALNLYRALGEIDDPETLQRRMRNLEAQRDRQAEAAGRPGAGPESPSAPAAPRREGVRVAGLTLVGVGGAGLVAGGVLAGLAGSASGRGQNDCLSGLCLDTAKSDLDTARQLGRGADLALVSGAVVLGTGVVLLTAGRGKRTSVRVGLRQATLATTF